MATDDSMDKEIKAMAEIYESLSRLDEAAQRRALDYVVGRLGLGMNAFSGPDDENTNGDPSPNDDEAETENDAQDEGFSALEGISPVAQKWMRRSGITSDQLSAVFSLGVDEIDLVVDTVPGESKRARSKNVMLLVGIAKYLSTGAARFSHEEAKEACLHYDAYDPKNFAAGVKAFSREIGGSAAGGYQLNARGLTTATKLLKNIIAREG